MLYVSKLKACAAQHTHFFQVTNRTENKKQEKQASLLLTVAQRDLQAIGELLFLI